MKKLLSKKVLKNAVKSNWKMWAILTGVLCLMTIAPIMMSSGMPSGQTGDGGGGFSLSVLDMLVMTFFNGFGSILMLVYAATAANKLVASEVDKGTMSFVLNTPTTRKQIISSRGLSYVGSIIAMAVTIGLLAMVTGFIANAGMDLGKLWLLFLGYTLYSFAISGICFSASCWFNKSSYAILVGAGVPAVSFVLNSLTMIDGLDFVKYLSLNTLFDTSAILSGGSFIIQFVALAVIGMVLYGIGIGKFLKKDLPL